MYYVAYCDKYLCPGTLSCVHFPHHCPCAFPDNEDKVELGDGIAICASKGGYKEGETIRKIELARKGLLWNMLGSTEYIRLDFAGTERIPLYKLEYTTISWSVRIVSLLCIRIEATMQSSVLSGVKLWSTAKILRNTARVQLHLVSLWRRSCINFWCQFL